jgi:hypothetical protein
LVGDDAINEWDKLNTDNENIRGYEVDGTAYLKTDF